MQLQNQYLRNWQKEGLEGFLGRLDTRKYELTRAYQGSGKTLYTATCFVASIVRDRRIKDLCLQEIGSLFAQSENKSQYFAVVFVPSKVIRVSTIRDWAEVGVKLLDFRKQNHSPKELISLGFNGVVVTYGYAKYHAVEITGEWKHNPLIKFLRSSTEINYHGVLDECHHLRVTVKDETNVACRMTMAARFFDCNQHLFQKLHLCTGTPRMRSFMSWKTLYRNRIIFCNYNSNNEIMPDTNYGQQSAISDGAIVKTNVFAYPLSCATVNLNGRVFKITDKDLSWYAQNIHKRSGKSGTEEDIQRLEDIEKSYLLVTSELPLWEQFIHLGDKSLHKARKIHPESIGIIFCPNVRTATMIHKQLLPGRSALALGVKIPNTISLNKNNYIHDISRLKPIDWLITCLSLAEGFDYPDCKVNILIPSIGFLGANKISQMIGRTNRAVKSSEELEASCLTFQFKPIIDLVEQDQSDSYGICCAEEFSGDVIEAFSSTAIKESKEKGMKRLGIIDIPEDKAFLIDLLLQAKANLIGNNKVAMFPLKSENEEINEIRIRTLWSNWYDLVFGNSDMSENKRIPPHLPGVYLIVNAKTLEYLYVGKANDLCKRITNKTRWNKTPWILWEGYQDIWVNWAVTGHIEAIETLLKEQFRPKYDNEPKRKII